MRFLEYIDLDFIEIYNSSKKVFLNKIYSLYLVIFFSVLFSLFSILPALISPHITVTSQFKLYTFFDYFFMLVLALIAALNIVMQLYSIKSSKNAARKLAGTSTIGGFAALVGTATCPSCLLSIFGFMGVGALFFMVKYRIVISGIAFLVMLLALNSTSKKVSGKCKSCNLNHKKDL